MAYSSGRALYRTDGNPAKIEQDLWGNEYARDEVGRELKLEPGGWWVDVQSGKPVPTSSECRRLIFKRD